MAYATSQKAGAEALGTGFLLAGIVGSGIMAQQLSGGNVALELLCNAVATGAILVVLITMLGPISGAHFNPAVTLVFALRREIAADEAGLYVAVQILGGIAGVLATHAMFDLQVIQFATNARSSPALWFSEAVATFGLVAVILLTLKAKADAVPMAVGLYVLSAIWFTASTSFANPAVTVGRAFTDTFSGIDPIHSPAFIVAQLVGAVVALVVCRGLSEAPGRTAGELKKASQR